MKNISVTELKNPDFFIDDPITDILRQEARKLLRQALEAEFEFFLSQYSNLTDDAGRQRILRNGYLPEREIQSGIGPVSVQAPRVRDRHAIPSQRIRFNSSILPPYLRRSRSIEELIPWLYLKGVSPAISVTPWPPWLARRLPACRRQRSAV